MDIIAILRSERDRVARQLAGLESALAAFAGSYVGETGGGRRGRLSAAARARIAAAQKARWAKLKGRQGQKAGASATSARKGKRTMSAAARAKIAAAQRARWAKIKKGSKSK